MTQPNNRILSRSEFLVEVKNTIVDSSWKRLLAEDVNLCNQLNAILEGLHTAYGPTAGGLWNAAPKWTEMFKWTSCPLDRIRAVVLIKEPLIKNAFTFESNGYALGCRPKTAGAVFEFSKNTALVNFLKIVCQAAKLPWNEARLCERFRDGFNPDDLSRSGILFYTLGLTKGPGNSRDIDQWWSFSTEVLRISGQRATDDVPVLQLYRTNELDQFLEGVERRSRRLVLVKPRPWPGRSPHIAFFNAEDVAIHAAALRRMTYEALEDAREKLEGEENQAKRVIVELHQQVSEIEDGSAPGRRLNLNGADRLVAVSQLQLEYMRLQRRLEPILMLENLLKP